CCKKGMFMYREACFDVEDLPLWLKFTSNNYKLYFFSHITVKYRVQNSTSKHASRYINIPFLQQLIEIDSCFKFRDMPTLYYKALKIDAVPPAR
ncbi:hypothetical protein ACUODJ_34625, partial [Escherichia sp. HC-CC]